MYQLAKYLLIPVYHQQWHTANCQMSSECHTLSRHHVASEHSHQDHVYECTLLSLLRYCRSLHDFPPSRYQTGRYARLSTSVLPESSFQFVLLTVCPWGFAVLLIALVAILACCSWGGHPGFPVYADTRTPLLARHTSLICPC